MNDKQKLKNKLCNNPGRLKSYDSKFSQDGVDLMFEKNVFWYISWCKV